MRQPTETGEAALRRRPGAAKEAALLRTYNYIFWSTMNIVVAFFPLYFADLGFSPSQIGMIYAIGPAVSIAANLVAGLLSDKYRTIRKVLLVLFVGQLVTLGLLLGAESFSSVALLMAVFYLFQTPVQPLSDSHILLASPHIGRNYPSIRIYGSAGFALSALLFGTVLKRYGSDYTVAIELVLVAAAFVLVLLLRDYQGEHRKMDFSGLFALIRSPRILAFFAMILILSLSARMYDGFLSLTMREMGASEQMIGMALLASAASEIPVLFLLGKYGHKLKELPLLAFACVMYATRFFLMSRVDEAVYVVLLQLMHSVSFGIFFSTALRYMTQLVPDEYRASGQALYAVVWTGIAGVISGTAGGYFFQTFGYHQFYTAASVLAFTAACGFLGMHVVLRNR